MKHFHVMSDFGREHKYYKVGKIVWIEGGGQGNLFGSSVKGTAVISKLKSLLVSLRWFNLIY